MPGFASAPGLSGWQRLAMAISGTQSAEVPEAAPDPSFIEQLRRVTRTHGAGCSRKNRP